MVSSQRLGFVLLVVMLLPGDFCKPPGNDSCREMFGNLTIRQGESRRWPSLEKLYGRLVVEGRSVSLPALKEIVGQLPLVVIRTGRVHLPGLERLTALDNSSEPVVIIEGKVVLDTETLVRLNQTSGGRITVDEMSLEEFVWLISPRESDYSDVVFIVLCLLFGLLLPYAIVKVVHQIEIRVREWKVHDDVALMKTFLLDRRRENLSRLDAYVDRANEPHLAHDLHKILGVPVPKKATGLPYRHDPMRSDEWAEECELRSRNEKYEKLFSLQLEFDADEDKDDEVADLRLERLQEDKMRAQLTRQSRSRPISSSRRDKSLMVRYQEARETSEDRARKNTDDWDETPYDEEIGEEELGRWEKSVVF